MRCRHANLEWMWSRFFAQRRSCWTRRRSNAPGSGSWTGMDERGSRIADATVKAIKVKVLELVAAIVSRTTLQH